jgi:hypothetical protein
MMVSSVVVRASPPTTTPVESPVAVTVGFTNLRFLIVAPFVAAKNPWLLSPEMVMLSRE